MAIINLRPLTELWFTLCQFSRNSKLLDKFCKHILYRIFFKVDETVGDGDEISFTSPPPLSKPWVSRTDFYES